MSTWECSDIQCNCIKGTKMCGGGRIDLSSTVNSASQGIKLDCKIDATNSCNLKFQFLSALLPSGVDLTECKFGECVDSFLQPTADDADSARKIDTNAVIALSILAVVLITLALTFMALVLDRSKRRAQPIPKDQPGVSLRFENISYSIGDKQIVSGVSGRIKAGEVLAIMGPSGSGKTTFLDILASKRKTGTVSGFVQINGSVIDKKTFHRISGYVDQEDIHLPSLTVREVLEFSAALRLPESMSSEQKAERVDTVLVELGLKHIEHSQIGNPVHRGISGGEKRRLSIGVELVTNPSILFLDEPTSGLDSFNAHQVIYTLSKLAKDLNKTVLYD